jgi:hypothetical protein
VDYQIADTGGNPGERTSGGGGDRFKTTETGDDERRGMFGRGARWTAGGVEA